MDAAIPRSWLRRPAGAGIPVHAGMTMGGLPPTEDYFGLAPFVATENLILTQKPHFASSNLIRHRSRISVAFGWSVEIDTAPFTDIALFRLFKLHFNLESGFPNWAGPRPFPAAGPPWILHPRPRTRRASPAVVYCSWLSLERSRAPENATVWQSGLTAQ